jgi:pilus assembly protein CpaE
MTDGIKTLIALDSGVDSEVVRAALPDTQQDIQIVGLVQGLDETWRILQETTTDLLVIACAGYSDRTLFLVDAAAKQRSDRPVVVLSETPANGFIRRLFESGADDVVLLPESPERLRFALQKAVARKQGSAVATGVAVGPMICMLGPKGGSGKTVTASNLAAALADGGYRVALVDLDLQFGDVGLAMGLTPDKTIYDLAKSGGSLDADKIEAYLAEHESGARVLLAPTRPDQASVVTVDFLRDVYATLRRSFDYVIVDTPPGFTPEVIASVDSSSHICLVGMLDSLSLKNTKLGLETLDLMGYERDRVCLVLNRADSRVGIEREDVAAVVGRAPDVLVPSEREIARSINEGSPIVLGHERSEASRAFRQLAAYYSFAPPPEEQSTNNNGGGFRLIRRKH